LEEVRRWRDQQVAQDSHAGKVNRGNWPSSWRRPANPLDAEDYEDEDAEDIEMKRQADIRQSTADLMLVEQAKEWLLDG
jgi:hypothetical protein